MSGINFREKVSSHLKIGHEILYLTRSECENLNISKDIIRQQMEIALSQYSLKKTQMPAKTYIFPNPQSGLFAMSAMIESERSVGIKWVTAYNGNVQNFNIPSLSALIVVSDYESGWPIAIMDGIHIMETRTPAVAMVFAKYLANLEAETFGMIGLGREGRNHLPIVCDTFKKLKTIYLYDVNEAAIDRAIEDFKDKVPVQLVKASSLEAIVKESEVLACATFFSTSPKPTIEDKWISKGQTIITTDYHSQFHPDTINRADLYIVDSKEQQSHMVENGYFYGPVPEPNCEIGNIIAGQYPGRTSKDQLIVCNPGGIAVDDFAVTNIFIEAALEKGVGNILPL